MSRHALVLAAMLGAASLPGAAAAQGAGSDEEARALFDAATVAFDEGRYESALEYFQRAYELSHRAELLHNIGVAAERLRRDAVALDAFRRFLAAVPDSERRASVEARIAILERAVEGGGGGAEGSSEGASAGSVEPHPSGGPDVTGPVVLMIAGGLVAAGGAVMVGIAAADVASVENAARGTEWASVAEAYDRSEPLSIAGFVALGAGVALAASGAIWLAVTPGSSSEQATLRVVPALGPTFVGVEAGGAF